MNDITHRETDIRAIVGCVFNEIELNDDSIYFRTKDRTFKMYHIQECCEDVHISDICGDIEDIIGNPIISAEEVTEYKGVTWTFYKLQSSKGSVTLRWIGSSNGYYSEAVDFFELFDGNTKGY